MSRRTAEGEKKKANDGRAGGNRSLPHQTGANMKFVRRIGVRHIFMDTWKHGEREIPFPQHHKHTVSVCFKISSTAHGGALLGYWQKNSKYEMWENEQAPTHSSDMLWAQVVGKGVKCKREKEKRRRKRRNIK